ncbi:MFS transporter [Microbulbifer flavimaris]|uniref:MFS transporter n=1 Tax=Microbulbifer flavimaris TaxID=1781068 RepID=A0ABX4I081_9GAMM|nr:MULTISPECIES: sugar MFS transporter [Microbulbifer]KUJ83302.1 MFS transporter [Microbulbifer sp. ZGT114]PCO05453.1 MFS transporter [Microbulbifer flavimaris]
METAVLQQSESRRSSLLPMAIIGMLFFIFGFVTWLNGSLIPFLKVLCELNEFQALFVTFAFYIAYTVMALPMSYILRRTGYRDGMAIGLGIMGVASLIFIPAAQTGSYPVFLLALFGLGAGLTILQTASNPYVVKVGPAESAATRIAVMGIINKGAGILAPIAFTALVLSGLADFNTEAISKLGEAERAAKLEEVSNRLIMPYIYMAALLFLLVGLVKLSGLPDIEEETGEHTEEKSGILQYPQVVLGALALFAYVGVEVIAGDTIGLYGERLGLANYASLTSYTMVFMVIGYLIGVFGIPRFISQQQALFGSAIAGSLCVMGALFGSSESTAIASVLWGWSGVPMVPDTVAFVALMGLAHALVWPAIWPLALQGLGRFTAQGSALLIMGIAGGAIIPLGFGKLAHAAESTQVGYWVALPCYLFILFYALKGHKMRSWK